MVYSSLMCEWMGGIITQCVQSECECENFVNVHKKLTRFYAIIHLLREISTQL